MVSEIYSDIRLALYKKGKPIPENDLWIAAICIANDLPLLTKDKHFEEITELKKLRACWDFAFGANAAKFYSEQGDLREHSHSYVSEEQRSSGENLARTAQRVKSKQALSE